MLFICAKSSSFWLRVEKTFQTLDWELQSKWPRKPFERNFWMLKIYNHVVLLLYQVVPQRCICLGDSRRNVTALQLDIWMLCLSWYLQNLKAGFWFFSEFLLAHNSWHICEFGSNKRLKVKVHLCNFCNHQTNNLPLFQFLWPPKKRNNLPLFHLELENVADGCQALMRSGSFSKKTSHWRWSMRIIPYK